MRDETKYFLQDQPFQQRHLTLKKLSVTLLLLDLGHRLTGNVLLVKW